MFLGVPFLRCGELRLGWKDIEELIAVTFGNSGGVRDAFSFYGSLSLNKRVEVWSMSVFIYIGI